MYGVTAGGKQDTSSAKVHESGRCLRTSYRGAASGAGRRLAADEHPTCCALCHRHFSVIQPFCQNGFMARKKTTIYVDESLLRAAKVAAARSGKREYEIFEDALQAHLGFTETVERVWASISTEEAPSAEEAARIAAEELAVARADRDTLKAG